MACQPNTIISTPIFYDSQIQKLEESKEKDSYRTELPIVLFSPLEITRIILKQMTTLHVAEPAKKRHWKNLIISYFMINGFPKNLKLGCLIHLATKSIEQYRESSLKSNGWQMGDHQICMGLMEKALGMIVKEKNARNYVVEIWNEIAKKHMNNKPSEILVSSREMFVRGRVLLSKEDFIFQCFWKKMILFFINKNWPENSSAGLVVKHGIESISDLHNYWKRGKNDRRWPNTLHRNSINKMKEAISFFIDDPKKRLEVFTLWDKRHGI